MKHTGESCLVLLALACTVTNTVGRNLSPYENVQQIHKYVQNDQIFRGNDRNNHHSRPLEVMDNLHRPFHMQETQNDAVELHPYLRPRSALSRTRSFHHTDFRPSDPRKLVHLNTKHRTDRSNTGVVLCDICPNETAIAPCTCVCHNTTTADIQCGSQLTDCTRLTEILNVATPVSQYLRLIVMQTRLQCTLSYNIWGPLTFQEIILKENLFSTLDNYAFIHFNATLKILNLEKNRLQNVYFQTLSDQPLLEHLILSSNRIMFIPGEGGITLNKLRELRLYNNSLTSINSKTFEYMPRLEILDLSKNKISSIGSNAFSFQNRVTNSQGLFINLSHNQIQVIPPNMVSGVENVTVNLQNNYIQTISEESFGSILVNTNFNAKVIVSGNPIACDVGLCWLTLNTTMAACFDNFRCSNMEANLYDLTADQLGCEHLLYASSKAV